MEGQAGKACSIQMLSRVCHAVYFALTLVIEAGIIKSLIHRTRLATMARWRHGLRAGQQHRYQRVASWESSTPGDVEAAQQGEAEDEDVREERLMIDSGTSLSCSAPFSVTGPPLKGSNHTPVRGRERRAFQQ